MPDVFSTALLLVLLCAAAAGGYFVKIRLPERHRSRDSFELVQTSINLLVTFTAIVLGLLTTSVKSGFDAAYTARGQYAAALAQIDSCLQDYGPRDRQRCASSCAAYTAAVIASTWPDEPPPAGRPLSRHDGHAADRRKPRPRRDHRRGRQRASPASARRSAAPAASIGLRAAIFGPRSRAAGRSSSRREPRSRRPSTGCWCSGSSSCSPASA